MSFDVNPLNNGIPHQIRTSKSQDGGAGNTGYFQQRKKQEEELRKSIQIGDEIVTIGGLVGKVVSIKEDSDSLVIETASEKMRIKKWAIANKENSETK